jgi:penicillin-binding protein 2
LSLATMVARLATGRAVQPHLTHALGGKLVRGVKPEDWPSLGIPERDLKLMREGMWAVVNEPGATGANGKLAASVGVLAGKTGSVQVRRVSREQRERGFRVENMPREWRPHALFVAFAPYENPQYAVSVVVEHGTAGGAAAAPLAREVMTEVLNRFRQGNAPASPAAGLSPDPQLAVAQPPPGTPRR